MLFQSKEREQSKAPAVVLVCAVPLLCFLLVGCGSPPSANPQEDEAATVEPSVKPSAETAAGAAGETSAGTASRQVVIVNLASINTTTPTYEADIRPLVLQICADCHFNFTIKKAFNTNRSAMLRAVKRQSKSMPPKPTHWRVAQGDIPAYKAALEAVLENYDGK